MDFPDLSSECTICNYQYNDSTVLPRILHCGHTFCQNCLGSIMTKTNRLCPICRVRIPDISVASLPKNFSLIPQKSKSQTKIPGEDICQPHSLEYVFYHPKTNQRFCATCFIHSNFDKSEVKLVSEMVAKAVAARKTLVIRYVFLANLIIDGFDRYSLMLNTMFGKYMKTAETTFQAQKLNQTDLKKFEMLLQGSFLIVHNMAKRLFQKSEADGLLETAEKIKRLNDGFPVPDNLKVSQRTAEKISGLVNSLLAKDQQSKLRLIGGLRFIGIVPILLPKALSTELIENLASVALDEESELNLMGDDGIKLREAELLRLILNPSEFFFIFDVVFEPAEGSGEHAVLMVTDTKNSVVVSQRLLRSSNEIKELKRERKIKRNKEDDPAPDLVSERMPITAQIRRHIDSVRVVI